MLNFHAIVSLYRRVRSFSCGETSFSATKLLQSNQRVKSKKQLGKYEGPLRAKYRICIYSCSIAYMNAMRNKSICKHVRYKLKVSNRTKRCPTQVKGVRKTYRMFNFVQDIR